MRQIAGILHPAQLCIRFNKATNVQQGGEHAHHALFVQVRDRVNKQGATDEEQDVFAKKGRLYIEFVDNPGTVADPTPNAVDPDDNNNPTNRPGRYCHP